MKWRTLVDPHTGEEIRAAVACSNVDRQILKGRKFRADGRFRMEAKNPRNEGFHRLVHVFGVFLVTHVEGYGQHLTAKGTPDAHAAVLQDPRKTESSKVLSGFAVKRARTWKLSQLVSALSLA